MRYQKPSGFKSILFTCFFLFFIRGYAQVPIPDGAEFLVNTSAGNQYYPSIAVNDAGGFVVVWQSAYQDADQSSGIYAQLYDESGNASGTEFHVNYQFTDGYQAKPVVAMDGQGNFVVVWYSDGVSGTDAGIFAQLYDASGNEKGSTFQVNSAPNAGEYSLDPSVAMDDKGNFVVAWGHLLPDETSEIRTRLFDASGNPQGSEFRVSTVSGNYQEFPSAAMDVNGNFVIAWQSGEQTSSTQTIYARLYDASGAAKGNEFQVSTSSVYALNRPSAAMDGNGNFVVAYQGYDPNGQGFDVFARRYDAAGIALSDTFEVNTHTDNDQLQPSVAMDKAGNFVISWQSRQITAPSTGSLVYGVFARYYDPSGTALDKEFQVNQFLDGESAYPKVFFNKAGDFILSYYSYRNSTDLNDIYVQKYILNYPPVITSQTFSVQEFSPQGTIVDTVLATDPNEGQVLSYAITAGNDEGLFAINSRTGEIIVTGNSNLDYELKNIYDLTIEVRDNTVNPQSASGIFRINVSKLPEVYIQGLQTVGKNTFQSYTVVPDNGIYSYRWSYSDTTASLTDTTGRTIFIGFNEEGSGVLQCIVTRTISEIVTDTLSMDITVNKGTGYTLPSTLCPEIVPADPCAGSYIDDFILAGINSTNSGCFSSGYRDNTQSETNSRLFLGDIYSAGLRLGYNGLGDPVYYIGMWIDYDNNGSFSDNGEFITSFFGSDSVVTLPHIPVSSDPDHEGPRRLRVQVRTSGPFEAEEGCIALGETGETEDYLVVLTPHDRLEGAHLVTPNNDGKNDFFVIRGINQKVSNKLVVFDRLGKTLFVQDGYGNNWAGTDESGELLPPDTYYYLFVNGDDTLKGFFQLNY